MAETNVVLDAIRSRRSCRAYEGEMVPKELIETVAEAGTWAATGMGRQSPVIVAVTDKAVRDELSEMNAKIMGTTSDPFYGAPVILIVLALKKRPTHIYDGSLVLGNMMLAEESLGLGSCWIHRAKEEFETEEGKKILEKAGVNGDEYEGIGHLALGYPSYEEKPKAAPRKPGYVKWVE